MKSAIAWQIGSDGQPRRLPPGSISLERSLEDWIDTDVGIVADDVLLIGRQIRTDWGTVLDMLGIDDSGDLVIVELKRDQTLRETVAQAIEYAAWVSRLGHSDIMQIAARRFGTEEKFSERFETEFGLSVPDTVNSQQRIMIVAPAIDDTTAFIIEYLSEVYRVPINAVSFDVFGEPGAQLLVRHFVIEESAPSPLPPGTKTKRTASWEDVMARARDLGIEEIIDTFKGLADLFYRPPYFNQTGWTQYLPTVRDPQGSSIFRVILKPGYASVTLRADNVAGAFDIPVDVVQQFIDTESGPKPQMMGKNFTRLDFHNGGEAAGFAERFRRFLEPYASPSSVHRAARENRNGGSGVLSTEI